MGARKRCQHGSLLAGPRRQTKRDLKLWKQTWLEKKINVTYGPKGRGKQKNNTRERKCPYTMDLEKELKTLYPDVSFWKLRANPQWHISSNKAIQFTKDLLSIQVYEWVGTILIQTTTSSSFLLTPSPSWLDRQTWVPAQVLPRSWWPSCQLLSQKSLLSAFAYCCCCYFQTSVIVLVRGIVVHFPLLGITRSSKMRLFNH